nr:molybdate ABC transporter substrate-binding protein [uncultured Desulfobulbus sp.]
MKRSMILISALSLVVFLASFVHGDEKQKLNIYCGITMLKPMVEIGKIIEAKHDCTINFAKGGSGKLMQGLLKNKNGDLFLPGSESYINTLKKEHPGLVVSKGEVGYNQAAIFVKKGNPQGITADLDNFTSEKYKIIIGSAEKGSIGKETKKILSKKGIYEQVLQHAQVTLNSSSLVNAIKAGKADLTINWFAASTWPENAQDVDTLAIDEQFAQKKKLVLAVLKDSKNVELAQAFLNFAVSPEGHAIFKKYGLAD